MSDAGRGAFSWRAGLVIAVACLFPQPVRAQSVPLGELSKKEAERRKTTPPPAKVYTNADLPAAASKTSAQAPPATGTTAAPAGGGSEPSTPAAQKPEGEERTEEWWRARMTQLAEDLRRNEVFLEALQSRVNALSADFLNRDDPYQRGKVSEDRAKAAAEMVRVTADIAKTRQAITDFEEEARKAGVPPGWLR